MHEPAYCGERVRLSMHVRSHGLEDGNGWILPVVLNGVSRGAGRE